MAETAIQRLIREAQEARTVIQGASAVIRGAGDLIVVLVQKLRDAIAGGDAAAINAAADELDTAANAFKGEADALAAAVAEGTAAASETPSDGGGPGEV